MPRGKKLATAKKRSKTTNRNKVAKKLSPRLRLRNFLLTHKFDLGVLLLFVVLACLYWWPTPMHLLTNQQGFPPVDAAFTQWIIGWGQRALTHYPWRFFEANMYYPLPHVLAWGDHLFGITIFTVPLVPIFGLQGAYNITLLGSSALSGFFTYLLVKYLLKDQYAGVIAGTIWGFTWLRWAEGDHIQTLACQWIPLVFLYCEKIRQEYRRRHIYLLAAAVFLVFATNVYLAIFTVIAYLAYLVGVLAIRPGGYVFLKRQFIGWAIGITLAIPLYIPSAVLNYKHPTVRTLDSHIGVDLRDALIPAPAPGRILHSWLEPDLPYDLPYINRYSVGIITTILAIIGLLYLIEKRRKAGVLWAFVPVAGIGLIASLGPNIVWGISFTAKNYIYRLLYEFFPGFQVMRYPFRWQFIYLLGIGVIAGVGFHWLTRSLRPAYRLLLVLLFATWMVIEQFRFVPTPFPNYQLSDYPAYEWLAGQPGEFAVLEFPISPVEYGVNNGNIWMEAKRISLSTFHWKKRVSGGLSPYISARYFRNAAVLNGLGTDPKALKLLQEWDVKYVLYVPEDFETLGWEPLPQEKLDAIMPRVQEFPDATVYAVPQD